MVSKPLSSRFVLASTTELHEKISELSTRVRDLEDSLRSSHSQLSTDPHPLLTEDLLRIKAPLQREPSNPRISPSHSLKDDEHNPDVVDAFGSLSISISGRAKYFGSTANSWVSDEAYLVTRETNSLLVFLAGKYSPFSKLMYRT